MEKIQSAASLRLTLDKKCFSSFTPILQQGVTVKVQVGCSLATLLQDQFGLDPAYLRSRIQTVFLEGKPVDDLDTASVKDGATLALSAALPGLAGATLRRGGPFASLRNQISHREEETCIAPEDGFVRLKLFNLLIPELGPAFLKRGFFFSREEFEEFLKGLPEEFWRGCGEIKIDGKEKDRDQLRSRNWLGQMNWISLSIHFVS